MSRKTITVDVREDIRSGREPFSRIMSAVSALQADEQLLLVAPFEPVPLYKVLAKQGFTHSARPLESGDWEVLFTREARNSGAPTPRNPDREQSPPKGPGGQSPLSPVAPNVVEVDARGLEPPQPMVAILEALSTLPPRAQLRAHTDRRPMHLYAQLEERGFTGETEEHSDGSFITRITRR